MRNHIPSRIQSMLDRLTEEKQQGDIKGQLNALRDIVYAWMEVADYERATQYAQDRLMLAQDAGTPKDEMNAWEELGSIAEKTGDDRSLLRYLMKLVEVAYRASINEEDEEEKANINENIRFWEGWIKVLKD